MRPDVRPAHTNVGVVEEVRRFGLDPNSTAHLITLLTDLYSDRPAAAVRELLTNALDSHLSAKTNRPVEITSPSEGNSYTFTVEDFGLGLDRDELLEVYSLYGASTKREDDAVGGLLGLGSKAPLTAVDAFNVTATKNGHRILAQVSKDEDGVPALRILGGGPVDAPNGVKIDVLIGDAHRATAFGDAIKHYTRFLYPGTVTVDGERPTSLWDEEGVVWIDDEVAIKRHDNRYGYDESYIVQHNVPYPVPRHRLNIQGFEVYAFVPTRTVNFTPSREQLDFTPKTTDVVETLAEYVHDRIYDRIVEEYEASDPYGKLALVQQWRSKFPAIVKHHFGRNARALNQLQTHLLLEAPYWTYSLYGDRASKGSKSIPWANFISNERRPVVIGYPNKTVTALNRVRLQEYFSVSSVSDDLLLILGNPDLSPIEGYPGEIVHWDDIVKATPDAKVERQSNGSGSSATEYGVYQKGAHRQYLTIAEIKEAREDGEITKLTYSVTSSGKDSYPHIADLLPDYHVLSITYRQVAKIERVFEGIRSANDIIRAKKTLARKKLSRDDYYQAALRSSSPRFFGRFREDPTAVRQVEDPALRHALELSLGESSPALKRWHELHGGHGGLTVPVDLQDEVDVEMSELTDRYALLHHMLTDYDYRRMPIEDVLIYLNAKYQTTTTSKSGEEAA